MFEKEATKEEPRLIVSNEFIDIYQNFNVVDQTEKIKNLSERERYLLIILCLDKHEDENPVVLHNFKPFREEIKEIYEVQDNKETKNEILLELIKETNHKHIESDYIRDQYGNEVPDPFDKDEVRDKKIDIINNI